MKLNNPSVFSHFLLRVIWQNWFAAKIADFTELQLLGFLGKLCLKKQTKIHFSFCLISGNSYNCYLMHLGWSSKLLFFCICIWVFFPFFDIWLTIVYCHFHFVSHFFLFRTVCLFSYKSLHPYELPKLTYFLSFPLISSISQFSLKYHCNSLFCSSLFSQMHV